MNNINIVFFNYLQKKYIHSTIDYISVIINFSKDFGTGTFNNVNGDYTRCQNSLKKKISLNRKLQLPANEQCCCGMLIKKSLNIIYVCMHFNN